MNIGGVVFTAAQLATPAYLAANTVNTGEGTLTLTAFNAGTGALSYSYTLNAAQNQPGATQSIDAVSLSVTDQYGNTSNGTLTVQILDSAPIAIADTRSVTEDQTGITGNVVTGINANADTMGADTPINVTGVQIGTVATEIGSGVGAGIVGTYGTFTLAANGAYTYVTNAAAQALNIGDSKADVFSYTIKDADGDFSTATMTFTVQGANDAPTISAGQTATVSEEGLTGGIADATGSPSDLTNSTVSSGQFLVSDVDNVEIVTLSVPVGSFTSNGNAIAWALTNTNHTLTGTAAGQTVMTVVIDDTGNYTTTLLKPIDHPNGGGENLRSIPLTVTVSDGTASATSTLTIVVEDDAPVATNTVASVTLPNVNTNIELTLDVSGSMTITDGGGGKTRLQLMKDSINGVAGTPGLLDGYDNLGDVRVRIVTFSNTAAAQSTSWVTVAQAKVIVAGLVAGGATNYDAAISTAQTAFTSPGKIPGAQNVSYFLSDGQPNPASSTIDPPEEAAWNNFLTTNDVISFSFGMGTGATQAALDPIAYNGVTGTNTSGVVVSDITQLPPILRDSVVAPTTGNVVSGGLGSVGFGADGGHLETLTIDGTTYTYDPRALSGAGSVTKVGAGTGVFDTANNTLTVNTTTGGKIIVNLDTGDYTYTASPTTTVATAENISYTVRDKDGDGATAALTINVNPPPAVAGVAANVTSISNPSALEGARLTYTVNLDIMTDSTTTFATNLGGGTATATTDYNTTMVFSNGVTFSGGVLTVPAGVISFTVGVNTVTDAVAEAAETVPLTIGGVTGIGTIATGATPGISITDVTVNEGAGTATFTVSLSSASSSAVSVNYSTSAGTATAGTDYTSIAAGTKLTFAAGETTKTITVNIANDTTVEGNETFFVNLATPVNATIVDNQGLGTIVDNEPKISIGDVTVNEAAGTATFVVSLSEASSGNVTVNYATSNGTATAGADYTAVAATKLTFAAGETYKTVVVNINNDAAIEATETFNVNLSGASANATILDGVGVGTIIDNDTPAPLAASVQSAPASASVQMAPTSASAPIASGFSDLNEVVKVNEDTTLKGSVLTGTTSSSGTVTVSTFQIEGNTFVFKAGETATLAGVGSLLINADGGYTFTPVSNYNGPVPVVTYTMTDGSNNDTSTLSISVTPVNDAPTAVADTAATTTDTPVTINASTLMINDSDSDGDPLTLFSVQDATHGTVSLNGSDVVFTPTAGYFGAASFNYTISDGHGGMATTKVDLTVNAAPIAVADTVAGTSNTPLTIASASLLSNDSDPNGDPLTISSVLDATNGTVSLVGGNVVFTPNKDYVGAASFTYTVSDGHGGTASASVSLTIAADLLKAGTP